MVPAGVLGFNSLQLLEDCGCLWLQRAHQVTAPNVRLIDLVRLDERVEAHVDALRIAGVSAWKLAVEQLETGLVGGFFAAGVLAIECSEVAPFESVVECAFAIAARNEAEPYDAAFDPWRGLVSALAWADRERAARAVDRLAR